MKLFYFTSKDVLIIDDRLVARTERVLIPLAYNATINSATLKLIKPHCIVYDMLVN